MAVTASEVIAITGTKLPEAVVDAMIDDASLILSERCGYSGVHLDTITKWLAAHLVASASNTAGAVTSDKLGDASKTFARGTLGDGLHGTLYGQQALALDTCGCLSGVGKARASVETI